MIETTELCPLLQVFDMPVSVRFYRDMLGFAVERIGPVTETETGAHFDWALLRKGAVSLMLNTAYERDERPAAPDPTRVAWHGDMCLYFGCRDVDAAYRLLRERGLDLAPPVTAPYGMRQLYLDDPDGFAICLQWAAAEQG